MVLTLPVKPAAAEPVVGVQLGEGRTRGTNGGVETTAAQQEAATDLHVEDRAVGVGEEGGIRRAGAAVGNLGEEIVRLSAHVLKYAGDEQEGSTFQQRRDFTVAIGIPRGVQRRGATSKLETAQSPPRRRSANQREFSAQINIRRIAFE